MAMVMEPQDAKVLKSAIEALRGVKEPLMRGIENTLAIAKDTGSTKFINTVNSLNEMAPEFTKGSLEDFCKALDVVVSTYEKTAEALGN